MIPYVVIFTIVIILSLIANKLYPKYKKTSYTVSAIVIIVLSIFAGLRALTVGYDISVYGKYIFERAATYSSLTSYISTFQKNEVLYYILNFIVSRFSDNIHVFLFVHQFIIAFIIHLIAYREKKKHNTNLALTIFCYLMFWFNSSLNIIRQSLAIIIILYSFKFIEEKKYLKYYLFLAVAFFFHKSSILMIFLPLMHHIYNKKNSFIHICITSFLLIASFFFLDEIFFALARFLPMLENYDKYVVLGFTNLRTRYLIFKIIMLLAILFTYFCTNNKEKNNSLVAFAAFDVVFYSFSGFVKFGYRISYFFLPFYIIFIPRIIANIQTKKYRLLYLTVIILLSIAYWVVRYVIEGYDVTIPYLIG